jgi:hypothetical protein
VLVVNLKNGKMMFFLGNGLTIKDKER